MFHITHDAVADPCPDGDASRLFGIEGLKVERVDLAEDGSRDVEVSTLDSAAAACPECGAFSTSGKGWVRTTPRDIPYDRPVRVCWRKRRWRCRQPECSRGSFTEQIPQIPARARCTARLRQAAVLAVAEQQRSVAETAEYYGLSWASVHDAYVQHVAPVLRSLRPAVTVLGMDESRRGKQRWTFDMDTLTWTPAADRFHTGFVDSAGSGGVLGHCDGRTAANVIAWILEQPAAWREAIGYVSIDMSRSYAKAATEALPHAQLVVDRFHVVALANAMLTAVRQRLTRETYGRRGRKNDFIWRARRRLLTAAERLTPASRQRLLNQLSAAGPAGQQLLAAWRIKEQVRTLMNLAARQPATTEIREHRRQLFSLIADTEIPEAIGMAHTLEAWWPGIKTGIHTGYHNAKAEGYHRVAKTVARNAYGFRNPTNHQRRVRWACTRQYRRQTSTITPVPG